jgi:signal transduction histidine kinase
VTKNSKIKELPEKASELSEIAKNNCDRLTIVINDILDFEKLQSGAMEFTFSEINLNILVSEALEQCEPYAEEFKVKFGQINSVPDIVLQGDAQRLNQVMLDLLSNAAKFSGEGKKVEVSISLNQTSARVSVTDYGIGINDDFRGKIFEKFSQAENPNIRSASGTGLGLSISRSIIEKHQGTIDFKSELKSGSTFYFEIPLDLNH